MCDTRRMLGVALLAAYAAAMLIVIMWWLRPSDHLSAAHYLAVGGMMAMFLIGVHVVLA
jgi:ferric-dicitrate binding protein FerR (iron transport regulator)